MIIFVGVILFQIIKTFDWSSHLQYEKAASILSNHDPPIILAKVDANDEVNKGLAVEFEVRGFPTVKILRNGGKTVQEYKGPRTADGIVEYLKKQVGPASYEIKSSEDAGNFIKDQNIFVVSTLLSLFYLLYLLLLLVHGSSFIVLILLNFMQVGIFSELSGEEFANFTILAEKLRSEYDFGHTLDARLLPQGDSTVNQPTLRLFKPFDELLVDFKVFYILHIPCTALFAE